VKTPLEDDARLGSNTGALLSRLPFFFLSDKGKQVSIDLFAPETLPSFPRSNAPENYF
jgi:hypothetical protein